MIAAILTTLLFATTAVCATQAALAFGAVKANFGRLAIAVVLLGILAHLYGYGLHGGGLGLFVAAGAIGFGAGGWCMFQAFPRLGSTLSLLSVECAAAVFSLVAARLFLDAAVSWKQVGFVTIVLAGLIFALGPYRIGKAGQHALFAGVLFATLAAVGQSLSWILSKSAFIHTAQTGTVMDPLSAAYQRLLGGVAVAGIILLLGGLRRMTLGTGGAGILRGQAPQITEKYAGTGTANLQSTRRNAGTGTAKGIPRTLWRPHYWILANALAGPVLGVSCMLWAIRETGNPGIVQSIVATATLFTVPLARGLETHRIGWNYFVGSLVALAGVAGLLMEIG